MSNDCSRHYTGRGRSFRRGRGRAAVISLVLLVTSWSAHAWSTPRTTPRNHGHAPLITGVDAVRMTVADMDRELEFFSNVLSFQPVSDIEVVGAADDHLEGVTDLLPAWNSKAGGIRAFYFKNPDGDVLEILEFPPGKGDAKSHRPTDKIFLGIDHTAIVGADTDASLRFYRDLLGFIVVGGSENHGPEQERLNNVAGARLRITTLRAAAGPGIELLEYLSPRDGKPIPADERANDLAHWQTLLTTADADVAAQHLRGAGIRFVSTGMIAPQRSRGWQKGFTIRDPDGHTVQPIQP